MIIGINGRFLVAKRTGVQRAAYNLLRTLVQIDRDNTYCIFTGQSQLKNPDWDYPNVEVIASDIREGNNFKNHLWEQFTLPKLAEKRGVDLLHSPANMAPLLYRGKSVVHIHDLCFVVNPQWYSFSFRTLYNLLIPRIAKRAAKIITNSNNSRNDLLQFCNVPSDRVSLVYWAVDDFFHRRAEVQETMEGFDDYILYVGSLEPRKNITSLIEAYELLRNSNPTLKTKLVLIGGESPLFADVRLRIKKYGDDVLFRGFVEDSELKKFYTGATLVAYPSLYEGFGLPPLEAMASGTPVVTSITSSLPEVVGKAALTVNPHDVHQLSQAMYKLIVSPELRQELIARGYEQVAKFNWLRVARNTLAVYYEVHTATKPHPKDGPTGQSHLPYAKWEQLKILEDKATRSQAPQRIG